MHSTTTDVVFLVLLAFSPLLCISRMTTTFPHRVPDLTMKNTVVGMILFYTRHMISVLTYSGSVVASHAPTPLHGLQLPKTSIFLPYGRLVVKYHFLLKFMPCMTVVSNAVE